MANNNLVTFQIQVDGEPLQDSISVARLHVALHSDQESIATIVIISGSPSQGVIQLPEQFKAGAVLDILLGYDAQDHPVFSGELSAIELKVNAATGAAFYLSAISHEVFAKQSSSALSLTYGDNLLQFDGVAHLDEPVSGNRYFTETELRTIGTANVFPEGKISVSGCSNWFNGEFDVKTVVHSVADGNWETQLLVSNE